MKSNGIVLVIALFITGCGGTASDSGLMGVVEKQGTDVTVLQAWLGKNANLDLGGLYGGDHRLKADLCEEAERRTYPNSTSTYVEKNCSAQLEQAAKLDGHQMVSPMINVARHAYYEAPQYGRYTISGMCELIEFRTVTANEILAQESFAGIGFYFSASSSELVAKSRLHKVGDVTLKNGKPATVHRFIAQGMCFGTGGNGGSIANRQYKFRPYAQYQGSDSNIYNIWDNVKTDYLLGHNRASYSHYDFVKNFDRQDELLKK